MLLGLKQSTPNIMIHGELGIIPLNLSIQSRILTFWVMLVDGKHDKISVQLLLMNLIRETYTSLHGLHISVFPR